MKNRRNDSGFINLIIYFLIFVVFAFTVYTCLDILQIIDVPVEYSVSNWLAENLKTTEKTELDGTENKLQKTYKKVKIQVEEKANEISSVIKPPTVNSYTISEDGTYEGLEDTADFSYYNQLDDYGKIIYKEVEKNIDNMKSGTYNVDFGATFDDLLHEEDGEEILNNSFQLAINAIHFDHPEVFYIDIPKLYLLTKIRTKLWITTYNVEIGCNNGVSYLSSEFPTESYVDDAVSKLENEKNKITSSVYGSTENKIRQVHDYLIKNLEYDSSVSKDNIYNVYGALVNKITVCEGYARAFKYIMDNIGIPCIVACGTGINSSGEIESHAWNYVKINNSWYAIDVTWDDPVIIGNVSNGYINKDIYYKYYLKGSDEFFKNHTEDGNIVGDANFIYPTLSRTNY